MKRETVEEALTIKIDGTGYDFTPYVTWPNDRLFIYTPPAPFADGTVFDVSLSTKAEAVSGLHLEEPLSWSFTSDFSIPISNILTSYTPSHNSIESLDTTVTLYFDTEYMLRSSVEGSFTLRSTDLQDIRTVKDGEFQWSGATATFVPDEPLDYAKQYQVFLNDHGVTCQNLTGTDADLTVLPMSFYWAFETEHDLVYVSNNLGAAANSGNHPSIPMDTITDGINRALELRHNLVRIEGQGAGIDYTEPTIFVPSGITLQGGWDETFTTHAPLVTTTTVQCSALDSVTIGFSNVSGCTIDSLDVQGGTTTSTSGIHIQNSSDIVIRRGYVAGGSGFANYGIEIDDSSDILITGTEQIIGGSSGDVIGIMVKNGSSNVRISGNQMITGGTHLGNNQAWGIWATDNSSVSISDNTLVQGGKMHDGHVVGVYVTGGATAELYRNRLVGGTCGAMTRNTAVRLENAGECLVYNNFITGGDPSTDQDAVCYGIRVQESVANIINNTIHGGGSSSGLQSSTAIRMEFMDPAVWEPVIVNNILFGGHVPNSFGLVSLSGPLSGFIFNNSFDIDTTATLVQIAGTPVGTAAGLNGTSLVFPQPSDNMQFNSSSDITFSIGFQYYVDTGTSSDLSSIQDNGSDFTSPSSLAQEINEAGGVTNDLLTDIDGWLRDRYSIDRGAHEFSP
jgi:hypothetical protein